MVCYQWLSGMAFKLKSEIPVYSHSLLIMASTKAQKAAAAQAQISRHGPQSKPSIPAEIIAEDLCLSNLDTIDADDPGEDFDDCKYTGGVHVTVSSDSESLYELVESKQEDT